MTLSSLSCLYQHCMVREVEREDSLDRSFSRDFSTTLADFVSYYSNVRRHVMSQHSGTVWRRVVLQSQRERKIYQVDHLCGCPRKLLIFVRAWAYHGHRSHEILEFQRGLCSVEDMSTEWLLEIVDFTDAELDQIVENCL